MISFAQNGEDVLLARAFRAQTSGFYVDVGAADPVVHSVTKHFYDAGWTGINIEPNAMYFDLLRRQRPRDINLNVAVSDSAGRATLFGVHPYAELSSLSSQIVDQHMTLPGAILAQQEVEVDTLKGICQRHVKGRIDFLKIDVEGHEQQALASADWRTYRPRIVLVEATLPTTAVPSHEAWERLLLSQDYLFAYFDGLNRYYVCKEESELLLAFRAPLNVFDDYRVYTHVVEVERLQATILALERRCLELEGLLFRSDGYPTRYRLADSLHQMLARVPLVQRATRSLFEFLFRVTRR